MKITVFSTKPYDRTFFDAAVAGRHEICYFDIPLDAKTAALARGSRAVCVFVDDQVDAAVLTQFKELEVGLVALRAAGYNNVDLEAAGRLGIHVARVPAYSPEAIAEHAVALMLSLDRNIHRAYARVREGNFALDGLLGFNLNGKTVGVVGTGRIGTCVAKIMKGFGCEVLACDIEPNAECAKLGIRYVTLTDLLKEADVITLHCPLTPKTHHLIDQNSIGQMKRGVMLINTSRGGVVDTPAVIAAIKSGAIGHLGLDVYEDEAALFFKDRSDAVIGDDVFERLLTFPNVLVTAHQAFFTKEAMTAIAETTVANLEAFEKTGKALHEIAALDPAVEPAQRPAHSAEPVAV